MMTPLIRLLVVDDHALMRVGLENMLNSTPGLCVVAGADNAASALALFRKHQPDVTLLDISMADLNGIECLRLLREEFPEARVLMLSSSEAEEDIVQSFKHGALGYLLKTASPDELTAAIFTVNEGKRVINPLMENCLAEAATRSPLTPREFEVLHLLSKGLSNPDIGRVLGIARRTAQAHVIAVLEKLEVADRTEAVVQAFERGLLKVDITPLSKTSR